MPHDLVQQVREGRCGGVLEAGFALCGSSHDAGRQSNAKDSETNRARPDNSNRAKLRGDVCRAVHRREKAGAAAVAAPAHAASGEMPAGRF
jgi:hypothetical protein